MQTQLELLEQTPVRVQLRVETFFRIWLKKFLPVWSISVQRRLFMWIVWTISFFSGEFRRNENRPRWAQDSSLIKTDLFSRIITSSKGPLKSWSLCSTKGNFEPKSSERMKRW